MLITVVYAYLTFFLGWRRRKRRMKYMNIIRQISRSASVIIRETSSSLSPHLTSSQECGEITYAMPKKVVDLNGWTLYMNASQERLSVPGQFYILCEAVNLPVPTEQTSSTTWQDNIQVTDHGSPIAWRPGPPFQFLMRCGLDDLVTLTLGMLDQKLMAEDNLNIQCLTTVDVEGHADKLVQTFSSQSLRNRSPNASRHQPIIVEQQDLNYLNGSNESLASVGKEYSHVPEEQLTNWRRVDELINENIHTEQDNVTNFNMADGDHGDCSAGEAMAELTDDTTKSENRTDKDGSKPPNVLIYCGKKDSSRKFEGVRQIFSQCLNPERYVIYHLKHDQVHKTPWQDNSTLLILSSEKLYDGVDESVLKYFQNGGRVMSFCSSLDDFLTERESIQSSPMNILRLSCGDQKDLTVIGGRCSYSSVKRDKLGITADDAWDILATADDYADKPVIVKLHTAGDQGNQKGIAILSQVYLDKDPGEMGISTKIFSMLKESNPAKFEILTNLLQQLGLDCSRQTGLPQLTLAILLAKQQETVDSLLDALSPRLKDGCLRSPKKSLQFVDKVQLSEMTSTEELLTVLTQHTSTGYKPQFFRQELYFQNLHSKTLGQVVLYTDVVPTTMTVLDGMMFSIPNNIGVVAIAGRQTSGRGRGGNAWLSPLGCAMFTLHLRIPADSELGHKAAFLQHITSVAVVHSVRSIPEYREIDIRLKWPNDIYFGKSLKLGGVVVTSTMMTEVIHALIGCGFNVSNSNPTICINDIIRQYNAQNGTTLELFSTEQLLGRVVTIIEELVDQFQRQGPEPFSQLYYRYWLHSDTRVRLESEGGQEVVIRGLDKHGFLRVCTDDGRTLSVQPDGNSFDMLQNLITFKAR